MYDSYSMRRNSRPEILENRFLEFCVSKPGGSMGDSSQAEAIRSSGDLTVNKKVGLSPIDLSPTVSTYDSSSPSLSFSRTEIMNENMVSKFFH